MFFKAKCSTRQGFSLFRNFTYNSHETYLSDTGGYFVNYQQFIEQYHRYNCRALQ